MRKRTESSRLMRGAREVIYEYILELHDRTHVDSQQFMRTEETDSRS